MSFSGMQWITVIQNADPMNFHSPKVDLGRQYDYLMVYVPVINASAIYLEVGVTNANADFSKLSNNNVYSLLTGAEVPQTAGNFADVWQLGGHQFVRTFTVHAQNTNCSWKFRGMSI